MLTPIELSTRVSPRPPSQEKLVLKPNCSNNCFKTVGDKVTLLAGDLVAKGWEPWHYKQVNRIGASKYLMLADRARKGSKPAMLFSKLLREALPS
jgi:hypothetical protein